MFLEFLTTTLWLLFLTLQRTSSNLSFPNSHSSFDQRILFPKMPSLQAPTCRAPHRPPVSSSFWGKDLCSYSSHNGALRLLGAKKAKLRFDGGIGTVRSTVLAMSGGSSPSFKMNLNEYMVTLEKPLGIRFALSVDGKIFVHALKRGVFPCFDLLE